MANRKDELIVVGEAPESDEEDFFMAEKGLDDSIEVGVIAGEGSESGDSEDYFKLTMEAFAERSQAEKAKPLKKFYYNSLLHQKLRESHLRAEENLNEFVKKWSRSHESKLSEINQKLLSSQIIVQDSSRSSQRAAVHLLKIHTTLFSTLGNRPEPFLPNLKKPNVHFIPPIV